MKGVLPWLVHWAYRAGSRDYCSASPYTTYFNTFVPLAQQAGQAAVLGRMSLIMCLW
jgi:hypothetical protein